MLELLQFRHSPYNEKVRWAPGFKALTQRYAKHPAADWVRGIYARHRGAKRDFDGPSASIPPAHG